MKGPSIFRRLANIDPFLAVPVVFLMALGTIMVYSASSVFAAERYQDSMYFFKRHLMWLGLGLPMMLVAVMVPVRWWQRLCVPALLGAALLLAYTLVSGVKANHAVRWVRIGPLTLQSSELIKPVLIFFVAAYIARKGDRLTSFQRGLLPILLTLGAVLVLILKQPDFGTTVTLAFTAFIMLFAGGARISHLASLAILASVGLYSVMLGASYRKNRLLAFMDPWGDPQGKGFQIIQSFLAFKRGGLQGQGLGDSSQKLLFLPEAHTDFIFSIIAEELGIWGTLAVIVMFLTIVIQGFRLAIRIKDTFASLVAVGLTTLIGLQALLNMGVAMALLPTKGLTLPFISYGGSSLLVMMFSAAILMGMSSSVGITSRMARRTVG